MTFNWKRVTYWEGSWRTYSVLLFVPIFVTAVVFGAKLDFVHSTSLTLILLGGTLTPALYAMAVGLVRGSRVGRAAWRRWRQGHSD